MAFAIALVALLCAATASAQIAVTTTPAELSDAIKRGAEHILITQHLDLRGLPVTTAAAGERLLFVVPKAVKSITANCSTPPGAGVAPTAQALPQCVLQAASTVFRFNARNSTVWLDALHLQAGPFDRQASSAILEFSGALSDVWITRTTLEGLGGLVSGITTEQTRSYVGGSTFRGLKRKEWPAFWMDDTQIYATAAFEDTTFENNTSTGKIDYGCGKVPAGIVGVQTGLNDCAIYGAATFRNCTFRNGDAPDVERGAEYVYADAPLFVVSGDSAIDDDVCEGGSDGIMDYEYEYAPQEPGENEGCGPGARQEAISSYTPGSICATRTADLYDEEDFPCGLDFSNPANTSMPLSRIGEKGVPWDLDDFLSANSTGLLQIREARERAIQGSPVALVALGREAQTPESAVGGGGGGGDDTPVGAIVGSVLGVLAVLVLAGLACALLALRRRRARKGATKSVDRDASDSAKLRAYTVPMLAAGKRSMARTDVDSAGAMSATTEHVSMRTPSGQNTTDSAARSLLADSTQDSHNRSSARPDSLLGPRSTITHEYTADGNTETELERVRGASVATAADAEALESVLDLMHDAHERFAGRFFVHNHFFRRSGGQGIVQFMQRCQDGSEMAVKFFLAPHAFERELEYYQSPRLREILVPVAHFDSNQNKAVRSAGGYVFPPFIVVERGESLNEWVSRVAADVPTTIFVLLHLAEKLEKLHANGLCHRDLKPANVLWRPTANAWTLMDFGCAAPIGERAHLAFSVHYAAPEVILADEAGAPLMIVDASIDMWALGVIAVELLTGRRVFAPPTNESEARDQLAGRAPLPWEDTRKQGAIHSALKVLKRSVLKCLERDPAKRPTSRELLGSWNGLFESLTGETTATYVVPARRTPGDAA